MTKSPSPRSRPAGARQAASEGRDGRSFFSRPKGEARQALERGRDGRPAGKRDERPESRSPSETPRGGERASYGSERRDGRPGQRPSYDAPRGGDRGGERASYGSERRDGRPGQRPSYDASRGGDRGGERAFHGSERAEGGANPGRANPGRANPGRTPQKPQASRPRQPYAAIRIEQVQRALGEILQWTYPADAALSHWLRNHPNLGARDRSEVAEAVYDVLRHLRRYRQFGESGVGPASRRLAILGLAATLGAGELAEGLDAAEAEWLRRVSQIDLATLPRAVRGSIPDWLDERLGAMDSPETLIEALNRQASLDLRVNPLKAERDAMLAELQQGAGRYAPVAMPYSPWGIRMEGRPAINRWPQFENGSIEVQDEGSQLLALLVGPRRGEMIIDFCAGAGGKTLLLGALMRSTGRLYAFDVSAARLARAKPRFARSGLSNVVPVVIDNENDARVKRLAGKAQRVLVDAPCSGIGTLRRNPDLKWRQHPEALAELGQLQERILNSAARCVAPGGRLVYATCSLLAEENEAQAERFLASHPDFERLDAAGILAARCENLKLEGPYVQLRPDVHGTDGFFAAVFERRKKGAVAEGGEAPEAAEAADGQGEPA